MTDGNAGKKGRKWLPALIAALVLVALAAWWFNRSQDVNEDSAAMAADPNAQVDPTGTGGQPGVPAGTNAAALAGGDRGNASAITNAEAARANAGQPGAASVSDGVAGAEVGGSAAAAGSGAPTTQPPVSQ